MSAPERAAGEPGTDWYEWDRPREPWLLTGDCPDHRERTLLLEMTARVVFPTVLVFSLYLLLVGHYAPGGGFSGGLVAGLAFVLRYLAGGRQDIGAAVRVRPPVLIGSGLTIAVLTALVPMLAGNPVLASTKWVLDVPVLGSLELVTSLFLDIGVYLLLVGVVLDLLRSLGAGIERDARAAGEPL
ncbi:MAG: cation transporter [Pseudonocardiales bacterium]|jgi:multicomponent Na+:H+ antiporter subunit B|nr:cation transporter [Pseudonocardiales bacterium]